MEKCDVKDR